MSRFLSWGRLPRVAPAMVIPLSSRETLPDLSAIGRPMLAYGLGRSYGDSCLNEGGVLLTTRGLSRFIAFDEDTGVLRCEAGTSLAEILETFVPRGWSLPVTPGTKYVTVGGAIANDVHGKNHHALGTFGRHVTRFELLRSTGERLVCSPEEHCELFTATIGGLGLTGLITWVDLALRRVENPMIDAEYSRMRGLDEFFELTRESDGAFEFTVAWVDCLARGDDVGRGIFMRGNHADGPAPAPAPTRRRGSLLTVPFDAPSGLLNRYTVGAFNAAYYRKQLRRRVRRVVDPESFFYPLDGIRNWNRLYGRAGFFQYQCVVPLDGGAPAMSEILTRIARSGQASFLAVLKVFGDVPSPGLLSFPRAGVTLALDVPNRGASTLALFEELDHVTAAAGGAIYPAKDARMSPARFRESFPRLEEFARCVDPGFSSSFWRRVAA
jgi:FAD/FMN-containing dehydrogenase